MFCSDPGPWFTDAQNDISKSARLDVIDHTLRDILGDDGNRASTIEELETIKLMSREYEE
jgi:hypothetical protein